MRFAKFDFLLMFRENFVTNQFRWMLETVIFVYVVLYPWCVGAPSVRGRKRKELAEILLGGARNAAQSSEKDDADVPHLGIYSRFYR